MELSASDAEALVTGNALTANALTANALTANALTANALTANALTANALTANALRDVSAQELLHYVVGCALPAGTTLTISVGKQTLTYSGELGLAPSWGEVGGTCDAECQGWVSACVLARINNKGVSVPISMRGDAPTLNVSREERGRFTAREGAYFGNIFEVPQRRFACLSPDKSGLPRVCGDDITGCVVEVVGSCDVACSGVRPDGGFQNCTDEISGGGSTPIVLGTPFPASATVFLDPTIAL